MHASEYSDKTSMARGHVSLEHHNQTRTFYTTKLVFLCCKKENVKCEEMVPGISFQDQRCMEIRNRKAR